MFEIWLAFRPDTANTPWLFNAAVLPFYLKSNKALIQKQTEWNRRLSYETILAIDADNQQDRKTLLQNLDDDGWVELDEQLLRDTLTPQQLNSLQACSSVKIGVTATHDPIIVFLTNGGKPDFIVCELNNPQVFENFQIYGATEIAKRTNVPVIGEINIADPALTADGFVERIKFIHQVCSGLWIWGWHTGNAEMDVVARRNWTTVEQCLMEL